MWKWAWCLVEQEEEAGVVVRGLNLLFTWTEIILVIRKFQPLPARASDKFRLEIG
jgi:hypothetical protein